MWQTSRSAKLTGAKVTRKSSSKLTKRGHEKKRSKQRKVPLKLTPIEMMQTKAASNVVQAFQARVKTATVVFPNGLADGFLGARVAQTLWQGRLSTQEFNVMVFVPLEVLPALSGIYRDVASAMGLQFHSLKPGKAGTNAAEAVLQSSPRGSLMLGRYSDAEFLGYAMKRAEKVFFDLAIFEYAHLGLRETSEKSAIASVVKPWAWPPTGIDVDHSLYVSQRPLEKSAPEGLEQATAVVSGVAEYRIPLASEAPHGAVLFNLTVTETHTQDLLVPLQVLALSRSVFEEPDASLAYLVETLRSLVPLGAQSLEIIPALSSLQHSSVAKVLEREVPEIELHEPQRLLLHGQPGADILLILDQETEEGKKVTASASEVAARIARMTSKSQARERRKAFVIASTCDGPSMTLALDTLVHQHGAAAEDELIELAIKVGRNESFNKADISRLVSDAVLGSLPGTLSVSDFIRLGVQSAVEVLQNKEWSSQVWA